MPDPSSTSALAKQVQTAFLRECRRIMHTYRERVGTILTNADERRKSELLRTLKK